MRKKFLKFLFVWVGLICALGSKNTYAIELKEKETTKHYQEWVTLTEDERKNKIAPSKYSIDIEQNNIEKIQSILNLRLMGDNSSFDLRNKIMINLKNQMRTSQCWAFAMTTVLETNVAINEKKNVEFSPRHIDYATAKTFEDGVNILGFNREVGNTFLGRWRKLPNCSSVSYEWKRTNIRKRHAFC